MVLTLQFLFIWYISTNLDRFFTIALQKLFSQKLFSSLSRKQHFKADKRKGKTLFAKQLINNAFFVVFYALFCQEKVLEKHCSLNDFDYTDIYIFMKKWELCISDQCPYVLGDCLHNPDIEKLVEELPIPSLEEMENCLNSTREIVCYVYHPPCLHKPADNGYKYIPRGICRESCDSFYGGCQKTLQFLSDANKVNIQCKPFPVSVDLGKFPECQDFISKDTQKIEKCLLLEKSGRSYDIRWYSSFK